MDPIYLDHNATTPLLPEVIEAMLPFLREHFGNPSSIHPYGIRARNAVARAREQVAAGLGCEPDEILFTSGGTEANNLAIRGVLEALEGKATARHHDHRAPRHGTRLRVAGEPRARGLPHPSRRRRTRPPRRGRGGRLTATPRSSR